MLDTIAQAPLLVKGIGQVGVLTNPAFWGILAA
jgi:hypothetical protein